MRIAIVTAMWQRPEVFRIFAINTLKLIAETDRHCFNVFCVGSEGEQSKALATEYGFNYIEHDNKPLWKKWNAVTARARTWSPDYVLMMGSDDIMDAVLLNRYNNPMRQRIDFIGCLDWYFYDMPTRKAIHWHGYNDRERRGKTVGAGRMLSRNLLNKLDWQPWQQPMDSEGMDGTMMRRLKGIQYTRTGIRMGSGCGLDIKTGTNITPFNLWPNSRYIAAEHLLKRFEGI